MHTNNTNSNAPNSELVNGKNTKLIYPDLSYRVTGVCFNVHNELGRYCREKQYADAVEKRLLDQHTKYKREFRLSDFGNIFDFIVEDKIILELKAKTVVSKEDYYQLQRYLQSTKYKLGLLVNFRNRYIKPIRVIKIDTDARKRFI